MTAMRNSIYAILAVVVGVMLVGLLPGQLSNLAAPAPANLQVVGGKESAPNVTTPRGQYNVTVNGTIVTYQGSYPDNVTLGATAASTAAKDAQAREDAAKTAANAAGSKSDAATYAFTVTTERSDPYADVKYYGLWGVGLLAALAVYLASKRMLG